MFLVSTCLITNDSDCTAPSTVAAGDEKIGQALCAVEERSDPSLLRVWHDVNV